MLVLVVVVEVVVVGGAVDAAAAVVVADGAFDAVVVDAAGMKAQKKHHHQHLDRGEGAQRYFPARHRESIHQRHKDCYCDAARTAVASGGAAVVVAFAAGAVPSDSGNCLETEPAPW